MSILSKLSKVGAVLALSTSVIAFPAVAQQHGNGHSVQKAKFQKHGGKFKGHRGGNFRGNRGNFRGNRGGFRGNRGNFRGNNFRGNRGFNSRRGFSNRRGFNNHNSFNRGFKGKKFGHNGFKGNKFGHNGFNNHNGFRRNNFGHNNFRGRSFRGNNFGGSGFNRGFKKKVVHAPIYSVGGFYGVHSNSVFISDFGAHGLYTPPTGYHWVCDKGSKDAILAAVATGAIIAVAADILVTPY